MSHPRVLLVTKGLDIGGIERVVVDLARGLTASGVGVEVAVVNDRRDGLMDVLLRGGVPVRRLGGHDHVGLAAGRRLMSLVSEKRFDVIHAHGPLPAVVARSAPKGRPLVTTAHTAWPALHPGTRVAWLATAHRDAAAVAVSATVAASLPTRLAERTRVIPHGADPVAVASAMAAHPTKSRASDDTVVAIAVASHRDVKNYPNLLKALRIARDGGVHVRLVAVGEGPSLARHQQLARQLGLADVVEFAAPTSDGLGAIAAADFLVVASDFEGQPLVVNEALALGKPVVATAVGRVPELVGPSVGRVVRPKDPRALGAAIAELASDHKLRRSMGATARSQGQAWTLSNAIEAHLALYDEVAGG